MKTESCLCVKSHRGLEWGGKVAFLIAGTRCNSFWQVTHAILQLRGHLHVYVLKGSAFLFLCQWRNWFRLSRSIKSNVIYNKKLETSPNILHKVVLYRLYSIILIIIKFLVMVSYCHWKDDLRVWFIIFGHVYFKAN